MKTKLCDVNAAALEKLPEHTGDKSGVGVHYVDAYIKPMNLKLPDGTPVPRAGRLTAYAPPSGPRVRVDGYGYAGYTTSLRYDSLLAKVIVRGRSYERALANVENALREFHVGGVPTNIPLLLSILDLPVMKTGEFDTLLVAENLGALLAASTHQATIAPPGFLDRRAADCRGNR